MKLALRRYKLLSLSVLAFLIIAPLLVFGDIDTPGTGFRTFANTATKLIYPTGYPTKCVSNTSDNSYFIPTKTAYEFAQFAANLPFGVSFCLFCGDGTCNNGETCSTCQPDCGACGVSCPDDYHEEAPCNTAGCYWHKYGPICADGPCYYNYSELDCGNDDCYWDSYNATCVDVPCSYYNYSEFACGAALYATMDRCYWDSSLAVCVQGCRNILSETACPLAGCTWDINMYFCY